MLIPALLLSLLAGPEATPTEALVNCAVTEHSFEASNNTKQTLVVSFATPDRRSVLHLALPSNGKLDFSFPEHALRGSWIEISFLSSRHFVSTGAMRLPNIGSLNLSSTDGELRGTIPEGTLLPDSIASFVKYPTCASALDVGVPPPSDEPIVDEVTDLRRRCRRPI